MKNVFLITLIFYFLDCSAQNPNKNFEKILKEMSVHYTDKNYQKSYNLALKVLEIDSKNLSALHCKLFSAFEIKQSDACIEAADAIIAVIDRSTLFPYLEEDSRKRQLLRFAYNLKAWISYEKSENKAVLEKALENINTALSITSPIDKDEYMNAYMDTKVRILLKLNRNNEAYSTARIALKSDPLFRDLRDIKESEGYKNYLTQLNISGWGKYQKGIETETAIEAFRRYENFIKLYAKDEGEEVEFYHQIEWKKEKFKKKEIEEVEKKLNIKFPKEYIDFVTKYGNFSISGGYFLLKPHEIIRLSDALKTEWNVDIEKKCNAAQRDNLRNLICFGTGEEGSQDIWYYCFSMKTLHPTTQFMDVIEYNQDDWWHLTESPGYKYEHKRSGFDLYISELVDQLINDILED
ncbi:MAG TPA: SMI1/KNR4 family protein [Saprospiraceae bacterium]|nr:SMI1/KNR4 family protein [Saprospiraceae bacterium]